MIIVAREAKVWIRKVVSQRCSVLPLRLYDITSQQFITRSELLEVVNQQVFEQYRSSRPSLHCLEFISDADARQIKWFVLYYTKFAILSHTWGSSELSYQKICNGDQVIMHDRKFAGFSRVATDFECRHGELDESIRSMFMWYRMAYVCIVYLESGHGSVDRWFFRGWTLQELLAPKRMSFCGRNWERAFPLPAEAAVSNNGSHPACDVVRKFGLQHYENLDTEIDVEEYDEEEAAFVIPELSNMFIDVEDMAGYQPSPENAKIIFQYMACRRTSVPEDMAYCLLGLLGIVLPIAYGEGQEHALYRLQVAYASFTDQLNAPKKPVGSIKSAHPW
ncbi:hypothetical protein ONZ45_g12911 [Pleurotus djamor]|nr:hypothetical protein ONZ45_g12911 [Pleurotus djamor]